MKPVYVVAAIFVRDGRVLAARRAAHKAAAGQWEFAGGKVEAGEDPTVALEREIAEELGVAVTVGDLVDDSITQTEGGPIRLACYFVTAISTLPTSSSDHDALAWLSRDEMSDVKWAAPDLPAVAKLIANWPEA